MTRSLIGRLLELFANEKALLAAGLIGFGYAGLCGAMILIHGPVIEPEGHLFKAASFDFALGFYAITLALLAPIAGFSKWGGRVWHGFFITLLLASYNMETVQILRGLDPRFTQAGSAFDQLLGGIFFLTAQGLIAVFIVITLKFFRHRGDADPVLVVAVRYGTNTTLLGFAVGYVLSANAGPDIGASGNLLPLHAAGFHGLQAIPLVALLLWGSDVTTEKRRRWVHLAGLSWIGACTGIAVQTWAGRSVLEPSVPTVAMALLFAAWAGIGLRVAHAGGLAFAKQPAG